MATTSDERWAGALDHALTRLVDVSAMDIAMAARATADGRGMVIERLRGAQTTAMRDLVVHTGTGLGGKAVVLRKPVTVTDYVQAKGISHQYDQAVSAEGIHSILAVPLIVSGRVTGVLYAALRQRLGIGDRLQQAATRIAQDTERRLTPVITPPHPAREIRQPDVYRELGEIIDRIDDPSIRTDLESIRARLATRAPATPSATLSEREYEALRYAALGLGNAEIAERMGLVHGTVKAYLRSVMHKLDCHNRIAAVNAARALGYDL